MNLRAKKQVLITDLMNKSAPTKVNNQKQSKRAQQGNKNSERDQKLDHDLRNDHKSKNRNKSNNQGARNNSEVPKTKKRGRQEFERDLQEEEKMTNKQTKNRKADKIKVNISPKRNQHQTKNKKSKQRESDADMIVQDLAAISNIQLRGKRMKKDESKHDDNEMITLRDIKSNNRGRNKSLAEAQSDQKQVQIRQVISHNLGVRKIVALQNGQPHNQLVNKQVEMKQDEPAQKSKQRGRPKFVKINEDLNDSQTNIIKSNNHLNIQLDTQRAKSKHRKFKIQNKSLDIIDIDCDERVNNKKQSRKSLSADAKQTKPVFVEQSITNQRVLRNYNILMNKKDQHNASVVFKNEDMKLKTLYIKLNNEDNKEEISESEIIYRRAVQEFLNENPEFNQLNQFMKKRKQKVKKDLLESEGLFEVYKQWQPMKQRADVGKKQFYDKI